MTEGVDGGGKEGGGVFAFIQKTYWYRTKGREEMFFLQVGENTAILFVAGKGMRLPNGGGKRGGEF